MLDLKQMRKCQVLCALFQRIIQLWWTEINKGLKIFGAAQKKLNLRKVTTKADHFYAYKSGCLFASHIRGYKVWVHRKKTLGILG